MNDLFSGAPLSAALGLTALALLPLLLMSITSFAKIAVVLSILKNALGGSDIPSTAIVTALSLALSVFVMAPVASEVQKRLALAGDKLDAGSVLSATAEPVRGFLAKNAGEREVALFVELGQKKQMNLTKTDLPILWPSFAITELRRAFQMGFLIFLPFLVLDMIVAAALLSMGLHGLTPAAVALPFKLLLFVAVDGFALLSRALVLGYA